MSNEICEVPIISSVCDGVDDIFGDGIAELVTMPFTWLAAASANTAAWLFEGVWAVFHTTTLVDLLDPAYLQVYNVIFGIAVLITFAFFCLQLIGSLIRREPGALARAATGMAKSIVGSFVLVTITVILLEIVDQLSMGIIQATGTTLEEMGVKIAALVAGLAALNMGAPGVAALVTIFLSFLAISGAIIVWFSLLVRKALILVCVVLGPIALAGAGWDVTKGWFAKWLTFVVALIFSKLIVVLIFLVAITQVNAPIDMDISAISDPIAGIVLMFTAAFAPYLAYKLLAFAGADMYHLAATEQDAKQAMNRPLPVPHAPKADAPRRVLEGSGDGNKNSGDSAGSKPQSPPSTPGAGDEGAAGPAGAGAKPAASTAQAGSGAATTGGGAAGGGAGAGAAAGAGAGAAAGPAGIAVGAGLAVAKKAADAGPATGAAVAGATEGQAGAATDGATAPPSAAPGGAHTSPAPQQGAQPPAQEQPKPPKAEPPATR
ncbi:MAG: conjugal transfer protein TrbL [Brachybacterium tyrofermentans]|uniref:conjugal transfer protein TrbL n=1 Tax=Brevibacterium sp. FME17 TaxID=2742606 RepID=UPI002656BDFC|nr:conjugal transfer protein TrbL [Brevibacterium sp. FME17]MDN5599248.1 type IV secretion system protein [Brachybacterium sp.]